MKTLNANTLALKLLLSLPLLGVLSLSFQQYQIGLLEKKTNKLFPMLANTQLSISSPLINRFTDQLTTPDRFASMRHWQRGLLQEWQGGEAQLDSASTAIGLAIEQRPGWPLMWRDLMRIGWKQELSIEERTLLLRNFRRTGDWNRQAITELSKLYLPRWNKLAEEERAWLREHVPNVIGPYQWVEQTRLLAALGVIPADLCNGIEADPEITAVCAVDFDEIVNQLE